MSLKNEFAEKMNLLERKLQDRDKKIEVLKQKIHAHEAKQPVEENDFPIDKTMVVLKIPFESEDTGSKRTPF